jgi:hypothetical protein
MNAPADQGTVKTLTTHYIDGAFVESHGREVMDIIRTMSFCAWVAAPSGTSR